MHDDKFNHGPRGEFRGDFTRDTFDPFRHFTRVLMQQGRVQVDADWNEQVSIFMYYIRSVVRDIGSEHWGPYDDNACGFKVTKKVNDLLISPGHYYVQGLLCENDSENLLYSKQEDYPLPDFLNIEKLANGSYIVYLDVWERHLSYVEDDYMREVALGGPDTATRAKVVWQVKLKLIKGIAPPDFKGDYQTFLVALGEGKKLVSGKLRARARKDDNDNDPCLTSPESRYRGTENQLYRVEIHKGGTVGKAKKDNVTFKWSRENGSVIYPVKKVDENVVTLEHLGRDNRFGLKRNDWVEIVDDDYVLQNRAEPLLQVVEVDHENMQVTLKDPPKPDVGQDPKKHPYLRRWDYTARTGKLLDGAIIITESSGKKDKDWLHLEDGVQVQFPLPGRNETHMYRTGDYWLIPARTETGDVEWPGPVKDPIPLTPHGVIHHYAPLQLITVTNGTVEDKKDYRRKLKQIWE